MSGEIVRKEHATWLELCAHLKRVGAVTEVDLASRRFVSETSGQELLNLIRRWGDMHAALCGAEMTR